MLSCSKSTQAGEILPATGYLSTFDEFGLPHPVPLCLLFSTRFRATLYWHNRG